MSLSVWGFPVYLDGGAELGRIEAVGRMTERYTVELSTDAILEEIHRRQANRAGPWPQRAVLSSAVVQHYSKPDLPAPEYAAIRRRFLRLDRKDQPVTTSTTTTKVIETEHGEAITATVSADKDDEQPYSIAVGSYTAWIDEDDAKELIKALKDLQKLRA